MFNDNNRKAILGMYKKSLLLTFSIFILFSGNLLAQTETLKTNLTLQECLDFALNNKPSIKQAQIDEDITEREIRASLSAWLPQVRSQFGYNNNLKIPTNIINRDGEQQTVQFGVKNNSNVLFQADQVLYNTDVLFAAKTARFLRTQSKQNTTDDKINTIVNVSKVFYDVLFTQDQVKVLDDVIKRQQKQYNDAYSQYEVGIVDKTDYKRATIALNNIKSDRKRALESIKFKTAYLKELIGYPLATPIGLIVNKPQLENELVVDTTEVLNFDNRIEFQQLQTQKEIQQLNTNYFKWSFLPTISSFINYNFIYQSPQFSNLYDRSFPASQTGLTLALPIFQGTRRIQNLRKAQLQERRLEYDISNTKSIINTEYVTAIAEYKSNFTEYNNQKENATVAKDVYDVIKLQYDEGIKSYLEVIIAESDLRNAQLSYLDATFRVLTSKLDVEKSLGKIQVNQ